MPQPLAPSIPPVRPSTPSWILLLCVGTLLQGCAAGVQPEDQRDLKLCVIGLEAADQAYLGAPQIHAAGKDPDEFEAVDRLLYQSEFETEHGELLAALPQETRLCVGVPVDGADQRRSREEDYFKDYLLNTLHWPAQRVANLAIFRCAESLIWTQDFSEPAGRTWMGQRILRVGTQANQVYRQFGQALADGLPSLFTLQPLPPSVSAEGGDLAVAQLPDGRCGLVLGRHRVLDYLKQDRQWDYAGKPVPEVLIEEARQAYEAAYGLPARVFPVTPLREGWSGDDLFHLDMVAAFFSAHAGGKAQAFVPRLAPGVVDQLSGQPIAAPLAAQWSREMEVLAKELGQAGFDVRRLWLNDHPVRSPANVVKYRGRDRATHVLLARYPVAGTPTSLNLLRAKAQLGEAVGAWDANPGPVQRQAVAAAVAALRAAREAAEDAPNPAFDAQAKVLMDAGFQVTAVPDMPWGAGGLHCQTLH